jgi:hypothetical protein
MKYGQSPIQPDIIVHHIIHRPIIQPIIPMVRLRSGALRRTRPTKPWRGTPGPERQGLQVACQPTTRRATIVRGNMLRHSPRSQKRPFRATGPPGSAAPPTHSEPRPLRSGPPDPKRAADFSPRGRPKEAATQPFRTPTVRDPSHLPNQDNSRRADGRHKARPAVRPIGAHDGSHGWSPARAQPVEPAPAYYQSRPEGAEEDPLNVLNYANRLGIPRGSTPRPTHSGRPRPASCARPLDPCFRVPGLAPPTELPNSASPPKARKASNPSCKSETRTGAVDIRRPPNEGGPQGVAAARAFFGCARIAPEARPSGSGSPRRASGTATRSSAAMRPAAELNQASPPATPTGSRGVATGRARSAARRGRAEPVDRKRNRTSPPQRVGGSPAPAAPAPGNATCPPLLSHTAKAPTPRSRADRNPNPGLYRP